MILKRCGALWIMKMVLSAMMVKNFILLRWGRPEEMKMRRLILCLSLHFPAGRLKTNYPC